jgi:electron transport complex protein RnfB
MAFAIEERCIGCTACQRICPVEAITGQRNSRHSINPKLCVDCGACARVCPVDAIEDQFMVIQPHVKRADWPKPVVLVDLCVDVCPEHCLEVQPNPEVAGYGAGRSFGDIAVLVSPKTCIGCRMCTDVCAKNAIVMSDTLEAAGLSA